MPHAISWFEIPAKDMDRAVKFYQTILKVKLARMKSGGMDMAMFPVNWSKGEVGGAIATGKGYNPCARGPVIFLNAEPSIQAILDRVSKAGGGVLLPKTRIPMEGAGFMAFIRDTEGNRIGLAASK